MLEPDRVTNEPALGDQSFDLAPILVPSPPPREHCRKKSTGRASAGESLSGQCPPRGSGQGDSAFVPSPAAGRAWEGGQNISHSLSICGLDFFHQWPSIQLQSTIVDPLAGRAVTMRIGQPKPKIISCYFTSKPPTFSELKASLTKAPRNVATDSVAECNSGSIITRPWEKSISRIAPPRDLVKLDDRLFYVLQPPLETLVSTGTIEFPFQPFPFQYGGVAFLYPRHAAILADEMGLGKTMQAIVAIRLLLHARELSNVLLICPKPLVTNWVREFNLWAPEIPLCVIEGSQAKRNWQWQTAECPIKIANYELMSRDQDTIVHDSGVFDLVVLDEAQRIKNSRSSTAQAICSIRRQRNWALTGTPIENSTNDIVGIFEFLSSGLLSVDMSPRQISREVRDFILRRTKDAVMSQMPPKLMRDAELELTAEQAETYMRAEEDGVLRLNAMGQSITIQHVFELVLRLKQICNFDPATGESSKMERLVADLDEVAGSGQKAIVFSQWVKSLHQIGAGLSEHQPLEYHGGIPSSKRDAILAEFRDNPRRNVLLMSYGAGSVGLNLQFCRYVFLFDRWWNPAVEDQAINRAHRIGVSGSVTVTRMLSIGTIEERINQVLEEKRELFQTILGDTDSPRGGLSREQVFGLFKLQIAKKPPATDAA